MLLCSVGGRPFHQTPFRCADMTGTTACPLEHSPHCLHHHCRTTLPPGGCWLTHLRHVYLATPHTLTPRCACPTHTAAAAHARYRATFCHTFFVETPASDGVRRLLCPPRRPGVDGAVQRDDTVTVFQPYLTFCLTDCSLFPRRHSPRACSHASSGHSYITYQFACSFSPTCRVVGG